MTAGRWHKSGSGPPCACVRRRCEKPADLFRAENNGKAARLAHRHDRVGKIAALQRDLEEEPQGSGTDVDGRHRRSDRRQPQLIAMDILGGGLVGRPAREIGKPFDVLQPRVDPVAADDLDDEARLLQRDLNTLGADPQLEVDGRFGKQTRLAVKEFQATAGIVADGIPGSVTMATIKLTLDTLRRSRVFGQVPGRNKLKAGSRLVVSPFPEIKFILSCCGVL
jgi:hypothetical protein